MNVHITIGLDNYSGVACGFNFENSVCELRNVEETPVITRQLFRLNALFPGTVVKKDTLPTGTTTAKRSNDDKPEPLPSRVTAELKGPPKKEVAPKGPTVSTDGARVVDIDLREENMREATPEDNLPSIEELRNAPAIEQLENGKRIRFKIKGKTNYGNVLKVMKDKVRVKVDGDKVKFRVIMPDDVESIEQ